MGYLVWKKPVSIFLWIMIELCLVASDTQVILGAAISLKLLLGVNLIEGVVICVVFTFLLLWIQNCSKIFEIIFAVF